MSSVEQSGERESPLGIDGLARLDVVLDSDESMLKIQQR
jgi:hypothetical protein